MSDFNTSLPDLSDFDLDATTLDWDSDSSDTLEDENPTTDEVSDNLPDGTEVTVPDADSFSWDSVSDRPVKVKVDGAEVEVPFKELRDGYMRQQDYTRKTQEAARVRADAEWATQIRGALQNDPQGTLRAIAETLGVQFQPQVEVNPFEGIDDPELIQAVTPLQQKLLFQEQQMAAMQRQFESFEQERTLNEVRRELDAVRAEFPDVDAPKVLQFAADRGLPIRDAYVLLEGQEALRERQEAARKAAETSKVTAKKQAVSASVGSRPGARTSEPQAIEHESFEDLFETMLKTTSR